MQTEILSDTDQSKQSLSPKFNYQNGELSELSFCEDSTSPAGQRGPKSYRKMRPASAPRACVTETNIWTEFSLPSYCMPDYRRAPAMYIEQDIINKQRQEIQLLMEELGNRDQELTDLVISHQKQVKAWECDNEKFRTIHAKLAQYEDEFKTREEQLKKVLAELANVNDQREVDVKELKRTQSEMIKLTERILENSLYIKEMEAQNQKLNNSLREFAGIKQAFRVREQELLSLLKEKDFRIAEKQQEVDKLAEYIKILECQCRELGEQNTNINDEAIGWRKKYCLLKEEIERLNDDCKKKEENIHKMTQQLHESLQQAIALQKALFTSCEREKCKEEVMYSLRRQHKRTMQELQNIRELYDRLTRDTTLYHLSIKEKEITGDGKRKEEIYEEERKKKKRAEETPLWHDSRRKVSANMSFHKLRQLDGSEESFLLKERMARDGKNYAINEEDSVENNTEEECKSCNLSANYSRAADKSKVRSTKDTSQRISPNVTPSRLKCGTDGSKVYITNQTTCAEDGCIIFPAAGLRNQPRNSESRITRSPYHSPLSESSGISQKANAVNLLEIRGDGSPEMAEGKQMKEKCGASDQGLNVGHTASVTWQDGMCHEVNTDKPQKDLRHRDPVTQPQGSTSDPKPSRSPLVSRKDDLASRDQEEQQLSTSDEPALTPKQMTRKKCVEFDMQDKTIPPCIRQMGAQSHCVCSESDCTSPQSQDRKDASTDKSLSVCLSTGQLARQQADGVSGSFSLEREDRRKNSPTKCEDSQEESSENLGNCQHREHELNQEKDCRPRESENSARNKIETGFEMKPSERDEHNLRLDICDQCRARGRRFCDCSRSSRSCITYSKPPTVTFAPNISSSDKCFPCQKGPETLTSKFLFVENDSLLDYCSSLRETENSHAQDFSKRDSEGPLTYPLMTEFKNQLAHPSLKKLHFSLPTVDSLYNQNQHHRVSCEGLPDEVSAYLARQRCIKRETYYNNYNRSDNYRAASGAAADSSHVDQESANGQVLSRSGQSLPSRGQSADQSEMRCVSAKKPQRTVVTNKEGPVFVQGRELQMDRQQKPDLVRSERKVKVSETDRTNVGRKRYDDNTNGSEDCGRRSCIAPDRFDVCRKTFDGDCKSTDDVENVDNAQRRFDDNQRRSDGTLGRSDDSQRRSDDTQGRFDDNQRNCYNSQKRSDDTQRSYDDCQRRSDIGQRRSDANKPRWDCDVGCDNSANNSNRESATCCSQSLCRDASLTAAREKIPSVSKHGLSVPKLKKTHEPQEKKLEADGEFQYEQTTQDEVKESVGESYFCPDESEDGVSAGCDSLLLIDKKKASLAPVRTCGHVSVRQTHLSSGGCLVLQRQASQHPSEMPQVVPTVSPTTNGEGSGAQNDKSGIILSLEQVESDSRFCEVKDRSGIAISSVHGRSDSLSSEVKGRSSIAISSVHGRSDSLSSEVKGRSSIAISSEHGRSDNLSSEVKGRSSIAISSEHGRSDNLSSEMKGRSRIAMSSEHGRSDNLSSEVKGRSSIAISSEHGRSDNLSSEVKGRSRIAMSSEHGRSDSLSSEVKDGSGVAISSLHGRSDNLSSEVKDRSGIAISSEHGRSDNLSSEVKDRSSIAISSVHGRSDSLSSEVKDSSGITISSVHGKSDSLSSEVKDRSGIAISSVHGKSDSRSKEVEARSYNTTSLGRRPLNRTFCKLKDRSKTTTFSEHSGSSEVEGRSDITTSSGHGRSDSRSHGVESRSNNTTSSIHRTVNNRSSELKDRSVVLSSTQLESRSFKQDGFTLYSTQERKANQLFPPSKRSDETSASQRGTSSSSFEPRKSSVCTTSSIHKQSENGFCELDHETRQEDYDSQHNIPTITSHVITTHCDSSHLDKNHQHHVSSDHFNDRASAPSVRQRSYNCAHGVAGNSLRNCCCSSVSAISHVAVRSAKSCALGKDVESINENNNADVQRRSVCA